MLDLTLKKTKIPNHGSSAAAKKKKKSKALKTISFNVTFSLYSELKMVKLRSSGPWHGYWAHLRRGEADTHFSL